MPSCAAHVLSVRPKRYSRSASFAAAPPKCQTRAEFLLTAALGSKLSSTGETSPVFVISTHQRRPRPLPLFLSTARKLGALGAGSLRFMEDGSTPLPVTT